jgi:hypothetical protein
LTHKTEREKGASSAEGVEELLRELLARLPEGAASLSIEDNTTTGGYKSFIITPSRKAAATIHVDVSEDSDIVGVTLGRAGVFEVPESGHRYSDLPYLDEVRALCLAAIRGDIEETVWFKGNDVIGGRPRVRIGSAEVGDAWRKLPTNPLRRAIPKSFTYEPYS